jgi:hypothetical protein
MLIYQVLDSGDLTNGLSTFRRRRRDSVGWVSSSEDVTALSCAGLGQSSRRAQVIGERKGIDQGVRAVASRA